MKKIDMHFHSTMSDGKLSSEKIIEEAKERGVDFAVVTEHDIVNKDFPILAKEYGIDSIEGTEISVNDNKISQKHLHITTYAKNFSGEIIDVLDNTRNGKRNKIIDQIELLGKNGFNIEYINFIKYFRDKGFNVNNLNSSHIDHYIFQNTENIKLIKELTGENIPSGEFIGRCLKEYGDFKHIGWKKTPKYEPTLEEVGRIAKESGYFLSLAHPNFNFKNDFDLFRFFIEEYKDVLSGIEINTLADKEWVKVIIETSKKYNLILTFGSDDHFERNQTDSFHGILGYMNQYLSESIIMENHRKFIEKINK